MIQNRFLHMMSYRLLLSLLLLNNVFLPGLSSCSNTDAKNGEAATITDSVPMSSTSKRVLGVARIEPENGLLNITAGTDGKIKEILIAENQQVEKGQVLMHMEVDVENAQLVQAQSKVSTQKANISSAKANLEALKVSLQQAQATFTRNQQLYEAKAETRQALDESKAELNRIIKEVEAAEADLSEADSRLNELRADIAYYKTLVGQKQITAPLTGKILKVDANPGDYVTNSTQIAEFAASGPLVAKTEVDELYAERVKSGQKAYIFSQTTGDTLASGTVSFTADYYKQKSLFKDQSTELEDRRVREVHIRIDPGKTLLIGSRVDCLIVL